MLFFRRVHTISESIMKGKRTNHMKNKKSLIIMAGVVGGSALVGTGVYLLWNSKKMWTLRAIRKVERILSRTGEALQSVSEIV